ncbi:helix-turn-helix domain-containing protein, partial [Pseudomonas nicosulfuronedens]
VRTAEDIGNVVRKARKTQRILQDDMADMIGKSHVHLRDIEKGKGTVALSSVLKLFEELGIRVYLDVPHP